MFKIAEKQQTQTQPSKSVKKKNWYSLLSPSAFGQKEIGYSVGAKPEELQGRIVELPLSELTGNMKHFSTKIYLKVNGKSSEKQGLATKYVGQELMRDQVERNIRRWSSRIDSIQDSVLKDGTKIRVKSLVITGRRADTSMKKLIRLKVSKFVDETVKSKSLNEFVEDINNFKLQKAIENKIRKLFPIKYVNIRKTEVTN